MSDESAAPGWYEQPGGPGRLRWWNGSEWTEHEAPLPDTGQQFRRVPEGVGSGTPWIWTMVIGYHLATIVSQLMLASALPSALRSPRGAFDLYVDPAYLGSIGFGFVAYGAAALLCFLDRGELVARGVDRPFHWAWAFVNVWVYLIGRTVVLRRRRARDALRPLFVGIAGSVVAIVVSFIVVVSAMAPFFAQLSARLGTAG